MGYAFSRATNWCRRQDLVTATAVLCLAVFSAPLFAFGPWLQQLVFGLLQSDATTIYKSVYGDGIIVFPSLSNFLLMGFHLPYPAMALLVSGVALRSKNLRAILARSSLATFLVLFCFDLANGVQTGQLSFKYLVENFAADIIGGLFIGLACSAAIGVSELIFATAPGTKINRITLASVILLVSGFLVSTFLFYASRLILSPTPVSVEITLSNQASGFYKKRNAKVGNVAISKSLLPEVSGSASAQWVSAGGDGLILEWASRAPEVTFDVGVSLVSGCNRSVTNLEDHGPAQKNFKGLNKFEILVDKGITVLNLNSDKEATGTFKVQTDQTMFWIDQDPKNRSMKVTYLAAEKSQLEFDTSSKDVTGSLILPLFKAEDNLENPVSRTLTIIADGRHENVTVLPKSMPRNEVNPSKCIKLTGTGDWTKPVRVEGPELYVILKVTEHLTKEGLTPIQRLRFTAKKGRGWLSLSNIGFKELENQSIAPLSAILIQTPVRSIRVNNTEYHPGMLDVIAVIGADLTGQFRGGELVVSGSARFLWSGANRLTPTRWERLDWSIKALLLTILGVLLSPLARLLFRQLADDDEIFWIARRDDSQQTAAGDV